MSDAKTGTLSFTLATWVYIGHDRGHDIADDEVRGACAAVNGSEDADVAGQALASLMESRVGNGDFASVSALASTLFGDAVDTAIGGDRDARVRDARRYQFNTQLPWLARIIDRFPDGSVGAHWVLVEQVSDMVRIMDPYPWDDIDEEVDVPLGDFMVKWELAGGDGLRFR